MLALRNTIWAKKIIRYGMVIELIILLSFFMLPDCLPEISYAEVGVEASPSISISPSSTVILDVSAQVFSSATQTIEVATSNYTGYTLRFKTTGASTDLVNSNNNLVIPTISDTLAPSEFVFGYGYSLDGENYKPVPSVESEVGDLIDSTEIANIASDTYNLSFGVRVTGDLPAGAYANQFQLTAIPNDVGYFVTYEANSEDNDVSGMPNPATQQGIISGLEIYLSDATPTRPGYTFLGWSEDPNATTADYEAGGTFPLDPETTNHRTLYAIWGGIKITYNANSGTFQGYWDETLDEWVPDYTTHQAVYNDSCSYPSLNIYKENSSTSSMSSMTYNIYEAYAATDFQGTTEEIISLTQPYAGNMTELDVMTFPGAEYLRVELAYSIPDSDDMLGVITGAYFSVEELYSDPNLDIVFSTSGTGEEIETWSWYVAGDTVTIGISTDDSDGGFGYYAQVYGYDNNGDEVATHYHVSNTPSTDVYLYSDNIDIVNVDYTSPAPSSNLIFDTVSFPDADYITVWQAIWDLGQSGKIDVYQGRVSSLEEAASATFLGTFTGYGSDSNMTMPINEFTMVYQSDEDGGYGAWVVGYDSNDNAVNGYRLYTAAGDGSSYYCRTKGKYESPRKDEYRFIGWSEDPNATTNDYGPYEHDVIQGYVASEGSASTTLYAVWQKLYSIAYDGNGADEGAMGISHRNLELSYSVDLTPSNFSRDGYGFAGWNTAADGSGTTYGPNESVAVSDISVNADQDLLITLYATWVAADQNDTLQTFTSSNRCEAMSIGDVLAFTDTRDNDTYAVAKLADGKCWMIENLRLDDSAELSASNTNNPNLPLINSYVYNNGQISIGSASNHLSSSSYDWYCNSTNYDSAIDCDKSLLYAVNTQNRTSDTSVWRWSNIYSYGNYYNVYSATSGNLLHDSNYGLYDFGGDLCPKGWRLPTGSDTGDYASLINAVNSTVSDYDAALRHFPNNYIPSGYYYNEYTNGVGSVGVYWSGSVNNSSLPRVLVTSFNPYDYENSFYSVYQGFDYSYPNSNIWIEQIDYQPNVYNIGAAIRCVSGERNYVLNYDLNGGVSSYSTVVPLAQDDSTFTVVNESPSRSTYRFLGWSENQNATTADYTSGGTFTATNQYSTLYAVWQPIYEIKYNSNNAASRVYSDNNKYDENATITPYAWLSWLTPEDYGFVGWSINPNAQPGDGISTIYGPSEPIVASSATLGQSVPAEVTFYAIWVAKDTTYTLQSFAENNRCSTMSQGDIIALQDARDSNTYTVAKLADDNCWMTQNLRLSNNETNSNWGNNALSQGFGGDFIGLPASENNHFTYDSTSNSLYDTGNAYTIPRYKKYGESSYYALRGNYYNWAAAIADTTAHTASDENVTTTSICPAGWHLPTGGTNGDFYNLNSVLNNNQNITNSSVAFRSYPTNFILPTGYYYNNGTSYSSYGYYWSSTSAGSSMAKALKITSSDISLINMYKYYGLAIRCLITPEQE